MYQNIYMYQNIPLCAHASKQLHHRTFMFVLACITQPIQTNTLTLYWFVLCLYYLSVLCLYSISQFCIELVLKTPIQTNTYI